MAAGVSITVNAGLDDFTMRNLNSRNVSMVYGVLNYDSASATALTISAANIGLSRIDGLFVQPKEAGFFEVASVSAAEWTIQPLTILASSSSTGDTSIGVAITTASIAFTCTGVPFFAFGYR